MVGTPKKEENVKQDIAKKETNVQSAPDGVMKAAKTEEKDTVNVNKQEPVKVNVGAGGAGGSYFFFQVKIGFLYISISYIYIYIYKCFFFLIYILPFHVWGLLIRI